MVLISRVSDAARKYSIVTLLMTVSYGDDFSDNHLWIWFFRWFAVEIILEMISGFDSLVDPLSRWFFRWSRMGMILQMMIYVDDYSDDHLCRWFFRWSSMRMIPDEIIINRYNLEMIFQIIFQYTSVTQWINHLWPHCLLCFSVSKTVTYFPRESYVNNIAMNIIIPIPCSDTR